MTTATSIRLRQTEQLELGATVTKAIERESITPKTTRLRDITARALDALITASVGEHR